MLISISGLRAPSAVSTALALSPIRKPSALPTSRASTHSLMKLGKRSQSCMNINQKPEMTNKKRNIDWSCHNCFIVLVKIRIGL